MPRRFPGLDVTDPIVRAVVATCTEGEVWMDERFKAELVKRGVDGAAELTLEELNLKLGPKRSDEYISRMHGLYRRHYRSNISEFRCAYFIVSERDRDKLVDTRSIPFPTSRDINEPNVGERRVPTLPADRRQTGAKKKGCRQATGETPDQRKKGDHDGRPEYDTATQLVGEPRKPEEYEQEIATLQEQHGHEIATLREQHGREIATLDAHYVADAAMLHEQYRTQVAGLAQELADRRQELEERQQVGDNLTHILMQEKENVLLCEAKIGELTTETEKQRQDLTQRDEELKKLKEQLRSLQAETSEEDELSDTQVSDVVTTIVKQRRHIRNLLSRGKVLNQLWSRLSVRERSELLAFGQSPGAEDVALRRLRAEWGAFVEQTGMKHDDALSELFDENGRIRSGFSLESMENALRHPMGSTSDQSPSLLVRVLEILLVSDKFDKQLAQAKSHVARTKACGLSTRSRRRGLRMSLKKKMIWECEGQVLL